MQINLDTIITDDYGGNPPLKLGAVMANALMQRASGAPVSGDEAERRKELADKLKAGGTIEIDATKDGALIVSHAEAGLQTIYIAAIYRAFNPKKAALKSVGD